MGHTLHADVTYLALPCLAYTKPTYSCCTYRATLLGRNLLTYIQRLWSIRKLRTLLPVSSSKQHSKKPSSPPRPPKKTPKSSFRAIYDRSNPVARPETFLDYWLCIHAAAKTRRPLVPERGNTYYDVGSCESDVQR